MIKSLESRGYKHGGGVIDPTLSRFIVNIPKNASSFISSWSIENGWRTALVQHHPSVKEIFVVLRDPIDRWISGIAQYLNTYILSVHGPNGPVFSHEITTEFDYRMGAQEFVDQYCTATERIIFDVANRFDDHVWPQCEIVESLPECKKTWLLLDNGLYKNLENIFGWAPPRNQDHNRGESNEDIKILQNFFRKRLELRPELRSRLQKRYQEDYKLIQKNITNA